ncbi:hypothetical protein VTO42DRAFT_7673 [Malbranchea cinnamomea]
MSCYPITTLPNGNDNDRDEENRGRSRATRRRSLIAPFSRRSSSVSSTSRADAARNAFRSRRSSFGDTQCLPFGFNNNDTASGGGILDVGRASRAGRRARSLSRASIDRGRAVLRSAFGGRKGSEADVKSWRNFDPDADCKPILSFRGGSAWKYLDPEREQLHLDLFWPAKKENPFRPDIFPVENLAPLCNFRCLTYLKLTGMMQSYQKYIWHTVWLNPQLEVVELEMALEPCIRRTSNAKWPSIKGEWKVRIAEDICDSYYGYNGQGTLERRIGIGEYLDKKAIKQAWERAVSMGCSLTQLPIVKLSLTGFVVDADPFFYWFNPHRLRMIDFKNDCVDAGFALPKFMAEHVLVTWPLAVIEHAQYAHVVRPGYVRVVDVKPPKSRVTNDDSDKENWQGEQMREKQEQHMKPTPRKLKKRPGTAKGTKGLLSAPWASA